MIVPKQRGSSLQRPIASLSEIGPKSRVQLYRIKPRAAKVEILAIVDRGTMYFNSLINAVDKIIGNIKTIKTESGILTPYVLQNCKQKKEFS